jgi:hypothetical protein
MIPLERGDAHNLEGRVTIYAELHNAPGSKPFYIGMCLSSHPSDIAVILNEEPKEPINFIGERDNAGSDRVYVPLYAAQFILEKKEDIPKHMGDIVFLGRFNDHDEARKHVMQCRGDYIQAFAEQIGKCIPESDDHCSNYSKDELKVKLLDNYVSQLIKAKKNIHVQEIIVQRLYKFSAGAEFSCEIAPLVNALFLGMAGSKEGEVISWVMPRIDLIDAINKEDYEAAAALRDKYFTT